MAAFLCEGDGIRQDGTGTEVDDLGVLPDASAASPGASPGNQRTVANDRNCVVGAAAAQAETSRRSFEAVDQDEVGARFSIAITTTGDHRDAVDARNARRFEDREPRASAGTIAERTRGGRAVEGSRCAGALHGEDAERGEGEARSSTAHEKRACALRQGLHFARFPGDNLDEGGGTRLPVVEGLELESRVSVTERAVEQGPGGDRPHLGGGRAAACSEQQKGEEARAVANLRSAMAEPEPIDRLPSPFGKFLLKRRLARGGMAEVFLASMSGAEGFEKELVVKLIRPELSADEAFVRRFVDEAKTCVRLAHPNIVPIFELGVEHGVLYMVMELVRGVTLGELLRDSGAVSPDEGAYLVLEVARALDHAHRRGVIHRDVTPGNVMIDEEGGVKLLDFGIAAPVATGAAGEVFGTPGHMAPEQLEGRKLTPASDLFALATVGFEAWSARPPFRRKDARASRTAMTEGPPPLPAPELEPIADLMSAMIELAPEKRPQHAEDVSRRLRAFLREREVDLDEIARGLAKKVSRALVSQRARAEGRSVPPPAMQRTMRPTPLAEGTRTFATRSEVADVPVESTRRLEPEVVAEGTRKIESVPEPAATAALPWTLIAVVIGLGMGAATFFALYRGGPAGPPPISSTIPVPSPILPLTTASLPVVTSGAPSTTSSATISAAPSAGGARLIVASSPPAAVEIDGKPSGQTPVSVTVAPGEHRVVLRPRGLNERFERRVTIAANGAVEVRGDFNDEPSVVVRKLK